jgi:hypothetical protein
MTSIREVIESPLSQGQDEDVYYQFLWSVIGTPSNPVVKIYNSSYVDVSSTNLSGSPSVNGTTVLAPKVSSLVAGERYRLECRVSVNGNVLESFCTLVAEK